MCSAPNVYMFVYILIGTHMVPLKKCQCFKVILKSFLRPFSMHVIRSGKYLACIYLFSRRKGDEESAETGEATATATGSTAVPVSRVPSRPVSGAPRPGVGSRPGSATPGSADVRQSQDTSVGDF